MTLCSLFCEAEFANIHMTHTFSAANCTVGALQAL
jgi:hypothetical protein